MNPVLEAFYVDLAMYWIRISVELPMRVVVEVDEVDNLGQRVPVRYGRYAVESVHPRLPTPHRVGVMITGGTLAFSWLAANHGDSGPEWPKLAGTDQPTRPLRIYEFLVPAGATTLAGIDFQRVA